MPRTDDPDVLSDERRSWFAFALGRLSSGPKMLLILSLGLLPLGIIAICRVDLQRAARTAPQRAEQTLGRARGQGRAAATAARAQRRHDAGGERAPSPPRPSTARSASASLARLARHRRWRRAATRSTGPTASPALRHAGLRAAAAPRPTGAARRLRDRARRRDAAADPVDRRAGGRGDRPNISREAPRDLTFIPARAPTSISSSTGGGPPHAAARRLSSTCPSSRRVSDTAPIAEGRLQLRITPARCRSAPIEVLLILLPVMMWLARRRHRLVDRQPPAAAAARDGSRRVVAAYRPGDRPLELPTLQSPAREIGELGDAFDQVTRTVARHEAELEAAVERQTRLVREVHHRVKNNLQVVASLLNIHSRGSPSEEVGRGLCLDPAPGRRPRGRPPQPLCRARGKSRRRAQAAGLGACRQSARHRPGQRLRHADPARRSSPITSTQDVAVSVAFLVTEIVEFGMLCGASLVSIMLERDEPADRAAVDRADSLAGGERARSRRFRSGSTGSSPASPASCARRSTGIRSAAAIRSPSPSSNAAIRAGLLFVRDRAVCRHCG